MPLIHLASKTANSIFCMLMLSSALAAPTAAQTQVPFKRHLINADSEFSSATAFDVNSDGLIDIVAGAYWYQSPEWTRHKFREVQQIRGRFDDYSNLALDVDADGDNDIISVNYRSKSLYWCENPGAEAVAKGQLWKKTTIDEPGPSETGRLVDLDGDGQLDILPNGTKFAAWYEFKISQTEAADSDADDSQVQWLRHDLPIELAGHGIGAGDINGDGRLDLVSRTGWAEAPKDPRKERWLWHPDFQLIGKAGLPILCFDVDQDGDTDIVWGRGHGVGFYWLEQLESSREESISGPQDQNIPGELSLLVSTNQWKMHAIDTRFACLHTLIPADIDGDGKEDLVVGKRFMGHDGKDLGENDPLSVTWYSFDTQSKTWASHPISQGGTCGIDTDSICADLDGDGDQDILAPARSGLHWIENLRSNKQLVPGGRFVHPTYTNHLDVDYFLNEDGTQNKIQSATDHGIRRQHILKQMELAMGSLPSTDQRVALDVKIEDVTDEEAYWRIKLSYASNPTQEGIARVPAFLLIPKNLKSPAAAMLCLHPTQFELGKAQICGLGGKPSRFYAHELATRGFVCLAPDYPSFADYRDYDFAADSFSSGSMKAIWDNIRGIDLLQSLPCVSEDKIGAIGHSLGGHNALFTAAFDQRIRCVVTSCGFTAFRHYYEGNLAGWTSNRYMPFIKDKFNSSPALVPFDFPEVLAAIAPRPVFVNAPLNDSNFEVAGVRLCEQKLHSLNQVLGESASRFRYPDAGHDFPESIRTEAYDWLAKILK